MNTQDRISNLINHSKWIWLCWVSRKATDQHHGLIQDEQNLGWLGGFSAGTVLVENYYLWVNSIRNYNMVVDIKAENYKKTLVKAVIDKHHGM